MIIITLFFTTLSYYKSDKIYWENESVTIDKIPVLKFKQITLEQ